MITDQSENSTYIIINVCRELFERFGKVDRVKKIKDYAFVHFEERDQAVEAMKALNYQVCHEEDSFIHDLKLCLL